MATGGCAGTLCDRSDGYGLVYARCSLGSPGQVLPACMDGINNDPWEDNVADWPGDPGCTSALDPDEGGGIPFPQCADFFDNNGNGLADRDDPACWTNPMDPTTYDPTIPVEARPECSDLKDNDGNQKLDATDPGCWRDPTDPTTYDPNDNDERTPECYDGIDNDGNGLSDANDPGCWRDSTDPTTYNPADDSESSTECSDNKDNDGNGKIDRFDSNCWTNPSDPTTYNPADDQEDTVIACGASTLQVSGNRGTHGAMYDGTVVITFTPGAHRTLTAESVVQSGGPPGSTIYHRTSDGKYIWQTSGPDYQIRTFHLHFHTVCGSGSSPMMTAYQGPDEDFCDSDGDDDTYDQ
jgi:hypothetical protein